MPAASKCLADVKTRHPEMINEAELSYVYRSAKYDAKYFNIFARLFILPLNDVRNFSDRK